MGKNFLRREDLLYRIDEPDSDLTESSLRFEFRKFKGFVAGAPPIEIFGGVTGFGVGGVPPFGAPATGALEPGEAACGLFWK